MPTTIAIVVGGGTGSRFGGDAPKQYRRLAGAAIFRRALGAFAAHPDVDAVQPVIGAEDATHFARACGDLPIRRAITGGPTRSASVRAAVDALAAEPPDRVLVHDAARPLVSTGLIGRVVAALERHAAVVPAVAVRDTLKRAPTGTIEATIDRTGLVAVQTPQGFAYELLREAHAHGDDATDDAGLVERLGVPVHVVEGEMTNLKVTAPDDLALAERWLTAAPVPRVGTGFDVHRLREGAGVVLGGITLPCELTLVGHSDADVALHALTDALLGTLGVGDIGTLFPPSEPRWKGADSALFLTEAGRRVAEAGGAVAHLDLTILCERPKIGPHRSAMRERIAAILGLDVARVSVKATTTERLGFTGRGEGIAAQAAATVLYPG
jgi:2-C-methyl-D-erythritol 4-phosphate cytidylyltransferase/2-C-methyl-D-erythritol 2,4-cyclodiphosphate synthase